MYRPVSLAWPLLLLGAACSTPHSMTDLGLATPDLGQAAALVDSAVLPDLTWDRQLIADRPYHAKAPSGYDPSQPTPLVLSLHGLGDTGANFARAIGLLALADTRGFLIAYPDGTPSAFGNYWNANDVCCQLSMPTPDDVAYLNAIVSDMSEKYNVDPKRIFIIGLSNGGMMSHRLGCDSASRFAAFISISGAQATDHSLCKPDAAIAALEIHGTADTTVPYDGGPTLGGVGPVVIPAHETIQVWVDRNACTQMDPMPPGPYDLDRSIAGAETTVERWTGCRPGGDAELWTSTGGMHVPSWRPMVPGMLYDWLLMHARN